MDFTIDIYGKKMCKTENRIIFLLIVRNYRAQNTKLSEGSDCEKTSVILVSLQQLLNPIIPRGPRGTVQRASP